MIMTSKDLCALIPHAGDMCLLESVVRWDEVTILCKSSTHIDAHNPLRSRGRLAAICGVEYAAQAMALHGALVASRPIGNGYLASVRDVRLIAARLDTVREELQIEATRVAGDTGLIVYRFSVAAAGADLVRGRASVFLTGGNRLV
jgi:predicted hotdog family 3-hydroxylacyl-ACP dehydratase